MEHNIKGKFVGYLWKSDAKEPEVYISNTSLDFSLADGENPFVIEGELYDAEEGKSYSIRFADGRYYVQKYNVSPSELEGNGQVTKKEYFVHRIQGVKKLKYLQYWDLASDELCEGMETLQPGNLVFIGFINKEE